MVNIEWIQAFRELTATNEALQQLLTIEITDTVTSALQWIKRLEN